MWVTVLVSALTAVGGYAAAVRQARIAARQAEEDRDLARLDRRTGVLPDVDSIVLEEDDDGVQEGDHVQAEDPRDASAG